jgi:hypothetical protein
MNSQSQVSFDEFDQSGGCQCAQPHSGFFRWIRVSPALWVLYTYEYIDALAATTGSDQEVVVRSCAHGIQGLILEPSWGWNLPLVEGG